MSDVVLESVRTLVLLGLVVFLWRAGKRRIGLLRRGWGAILAGFSLLLFASILDITDNYPSLDRFVLIGDTETEAILEKLVGYLGGFVLLAVGLVRWIPTVQQLSDEVAERTQAQEALRRERDSLKRKVAERTEDLELQLADRQRAEEALREARDELEVRVNERTVALRASESRLKQAARTARLGHWRFDEGANRYLSVSEEYARIFGYTVEEFLARYRTLEQDMQLVHPEDRAEVLQAYKMYENSEIDYRVVRADGELRHVREIAEYLRDETGRAIEAVGTLQDITELKEAQLEAERASRAKSEFLSRMNHELRAPLNAILGFGQLLHSAPVEQLIEKRENFVGHILGAGRHLLTLIDEVLDLATIETGRIQLLMEAVDLGEVLRECQGLTRILADEGRVNLENLVPVSAAPAVWADRARLKQILLNLLSNGVKYNHPGGRVTVSCQERESGRLRISVRDTGQGISEARIGELFEPFTRLGAEHSDVEGTGIGLSIVEQLTMAMGGELGVESRPGEGSTFWVELELRLESNEARGEVETEVAEAGSKP